MIIEEECWVNQRDVQISVPFKNNERWNEEYSSKQTNVQYQSWLFVWIRDSTRHTDEKKIKKNEVMS